MEFGQVLRDLRTSRQLSLKRLAPDLGVDYSYLSKLENGQVRPSAELVRKVAGYFEYEEDLLLLTASRIPPDIVAILREHPEDAVAFLRARFGDNPNDRRTRERPEDS